VKSVFLFPERLILVILKANRAQRLLQLRCCRILLCRIGAYLSTTCQYFSIVFERFIFRLTGIQLPFLHGRKIAFLIIIGVPVFVCTLGAFTFDRCCCPVIERRLICCSLDFRVQDISSLHLVGGFSSSIDQVILAKDTFNDPLV